MRVALSGIDVKIDNTRLYSPATSGLHRTEGATRGRRWILRHRGPMRSFWVAYGIARLRFLRPSASPTLLLVQVTHHDNTSTFGTTYYTQPFQSWQSRKLQMITLKVFGGIAVINAFRWVWDIHDFLPYSQLI